MSLIFLLLELEVKELESTSFQECFVLFVLFEWTLSQRKEVDIPLGNLPHVREQNKRSYLLRPGQS